MTDHQGHSAVHPALLYAAAILIWGSTWLPLKIQTELAGAEWSVVYRLVLASMLLFAWCGVRRIPLAFSLAAHAYIALFGVLLFGLDLVLLYAASAYLTSGLEAVVFSTIVVFNILNGYLFLGRRPEARVMAGAVIGIGGLALAFWDDLRGFSLQSGAGWGVVLCLAGTLCGSLGNILSVRNQRAGIPVLQANAYGMAYAALFLALTCLVRGTAPRVDTSFAYLSTLAYLAVFGSIFAFGAYLSLLSRVGPERAAYANLLYPLVALLISSGFEEFHWTPRVILGIGFVLLGNALILVKLGARAPSVSVASDAGNRGAQV